MTQGTRKRFVKTLGRKPISRYLYVEVRGWYLQPAGVLDGPVSFDHVEVKAATDRQAYALGAEAMHTRHLDPPTDSAQHHTGSFLNDYVVKL